MSSRSWISFGQSAFVAAFVAISVAGCSKDNKEEAPTPEPAPSASSPHKGKISLRGPLAPMAQMDPQVMKDYRLDICYYGTLALRDVKATYLASLGKTEPSAKKIPSFGGLAPTLTKPPGASPSAPKGAASATTEPKPGASASVAPPRNRPPVLRLPYEGYARACLAAAQLKQPAMPEVDAAVAAYAPFAVELAKNIVAANGYYQREEYKKDEFAKGKELHKKLVESFAKLEELQDKVGTSLAAWRKAHPPDETKMSEGNKLAQHALDDAQRAFEAAIAPKPDAAAFKANIEKLGKSLEALKEHGAKNANDPWAKQMSGPFDAFVKNASEAKLEDKGLAPESFLMLTTSFRGLIESRQRAVGQELRQKSASTVAPQLRHINPKAAVSAKPGPAHE